MKIRVLSSLADVDKHRWNRVTPSVGFPSSYEWLRSVEACPFGGRGAFVVAEEGDEYVGRFAMYLIEEEDFYLINPPMAVLSGGQPARGASSRASLGRQLDVRIGRYWDEDEARRVGELRADLWEHKDSAYPCAVCVSPFTGRVAFETRPNRDDVCELLIDAFFEVARRWQARSHCFLFVPTGGYDGLTTRLVGERGFRDTQLGAFSVMRVPASFDDYLIQLSSARRHKVRRELKGFAQSGLTLKVVNGTDVDESLVQRLAVLSALTQARHGGKVDAARAEAVLRAVLDTLGDTTRFFLISREDQVLSYFRCIEWGTSLHAAGVGQDYEALDPRSYAHFTAMYYGPLRYAIERGLTEIDFGTGADETKAQRGARLQPRTTYARFDQLDGSRMAELIDLMNAAHNRFREDHGQ